MNVKEHSNITETVEAQQPDQNREKNKSTIYSYFKEHTAFLVACVSALIAVISYALNYAATQYTNAYLQYWMVDTAYAHENKTVIYSILFSLLFGIAVVIAHKVMSSTANVFGVYHRLLSATNWHYKDTKKDFRNVKCAAKKLACTKKKLAKEAKKTGIEITDIDANDIDQKVVNIAKSLKEIRSLKRSYNLWLTLNVLGSALAVFGLILIVSSLMSSIKGDSRAWTPIVLSSIIVLFDFVLYFLPVYRSSRIKKKERKEVSIDQLRTETQNITGHRFPIFTLVHTSAKELFSDKRIKQIAIIALILFVTLAGSYSSTGKSDAEKTKCFPIYRDETGTYAVVYNNGESLILKSAEINENTIEINLKLQKVVSATDVTYEIVTFKTVKTIGRD